MRILVVGGGGREHALCWKLSQEAEVLCAPGNPGIASVAELIPVAQSDAPGLVSVCQDRKVDLVVIGPEDPLVDGLADPIREAGFLVYGPGASGARLEGSKAFSKAMMERAGVPTAAGRAFHSADEASEYVIERARAGHGFAIKASGNALGKGVLICPDLAEALAGINRMLVHREFGPAGDIIVIEDLLVGREFSLLTIVGDQNWVSLPVAQDYKRIFDGDGGPNTGGMGSYSPVAAIDAAAVSAAEEMIVAPILKQLKAEGIAFRGTLFSGIMLVHGKPICIEYNVRFGDPEIQTLVQRIGTGFAASLFQAASGDRVESPAIGNMEAVSVVIASRGYPETSSKGDPIHIGALPNGVTVFHAATALQDGCLVTSGGRVLAVTAAGATVAEARELAYQGVKCISFPGMQFRQDIAR